MNSKEKIKGGAINLSQTELYVSLDIGSNSVKCIIGQVIDETTIHMIGVGNEKSSGIRKGSIVDIDATVQSIKKAVNSAERMMGMTVHNVILGIPANQALLQNVKGVVAVNRENREITDDDLDRVIESAQVMSIPPDRELVNIIPRQFTVDNLSEIKDPRGMLGIRLEMDGTLITTSKTVLHNVLRCVEKAGLEIQQIYLQPLASGYFALTDDEKSRGTLFIDMGAESTTVAVYKNDYFTHVSMIPIGGENITKDLSVVLKTSMEQAEKIKIDYGHAYYDDASEDELFTVPVIGTDSKEQYSQRFISEIIGARVEEIFDVVMDTLFEMRVDDLPGGVVITGGVAKLEGIQQLASEKLNSRVRLSIPNQIGARDPELTAAINLIRYAYMESSFYNDFLEEPPVVPPNKEEVNTKKVQQEDKKPKQGFMSKIKNFVDNLID